MSSLNSSFVGAVLLLLLTFPIILIGAPVTNEDRAKLFVTCLVEGDFNNAVDSFNDEVKEALPGDKLAQLWSSVVSQTGQFKCFKKVNKHLGNGLEAIILTTTFDKSDLDIKVVYTKDGLITGLFFLPTSINTPYVVPSYVKKHSFSEKEVQIGRGKWALPGTLSLPRHRGPFSAVILVHGSGPNDRDETIGPNRPFRDLAWGLASNRIAVLRYDKRTRHYGASMTAKDSLEMTLKEETIDDALAAIDLLRNIHQIDNDKIFILGHSLGGMAIPAIVKSGAKASGFIIMAGNSRPLEDLLVDQYNYIFDLDGSITEEEEKALLDLKKQVRFLKSGKVTLKSPKASLPLSMPPAYWLYLNTYKPIEIAKSMRKPVLVMQGGRDYQVTGEDVKGWKTAFKNNGNVTYKTYPDLNHIFMTGKNKCTPQEYSVPGSVSKDVVEDILNWIKSVHK